MHPLYKLIKSIIWIWDRKAQKAFEQAKILVGQAKKLCAPLPQCLFLLEVAMNSEAVAVGCGLSNLSK